MEEVFRSSVIAKLDTTGYCVICDFPLNVKFPKDYPDEWKFCCSCFKWAELIATNDPLILRKHTGNILKKIRDKITLAKGNG